MERPSWGTAPIRCGRTRCKWRGFEGDLNEEPGKMGNIDCSRSVCPDCGYDSYMFMTPGEIAAWERAKSAARKQGGAT